MAERSDELLLGVDLGAAQVKVALTDSEGRILASAVAPATADAIAVLSGLLRKIQCPCTAVRAGVTGVGRNLWPPSMAAVTVNDITAAALGVRRTLPNARSVIDVGGQSSKWILPGDDEAQPVKDFSTNGVCAAGAGVFLQQQASRLGMTVEALGAVAAAAPRGATIAGRCSVFAKSDMIHLQQTGTPTAEIAYGLCQALVRTFASSVLHGRRLKTPIAMVGGNAANRGLVRAFREHFGLNATDLIVPDDAVFLSAVGAALHAREAPPVAWNALLAELEQHRSRGATGCVEARLSPLSLAAHPSQPPETGARVAGGVVEAFLGIDVGSVSTDLVVLDPDFRVLHGVYLPTRGQPVEAIRRGLEELHEVFGDRLKVLAAGCTGSGRHLAARLVGADAVRNEITAQAASAVRYFPDVDTIFEIGGQDSKYISLHEGIVSDFAMNKICSGGTGSFLEEQAERLGVDVKGNFAELAFRSQSPANLGSRCTVFMDSEVVRAQELRVPVEDICAGLAYAVARNYLEKVVAGRTIGKRIVFQGGTASNRAVVAAFCNLLGQEVSIHPYNRLSGAIGAALLAAEAKPARSRFTGFHFSAVSPVKSFECRHCENRCQVNQFREGSRLIHFGDVCERYSELDANAPRRPRPFPEMFAERNRILEQAVSPSQPGTDSPAPRKRIGLLRSSLNWEYLPFWTEFVRALGFEPVLSPRMTPAMMERAAGRLPSDVCLPIKATVAQVNDLLESGKVDAVFVPAVTEFRAAGEPPSHTCLATQSLPALLGSTRDSRIITAEYAFGDGLIGQMESCIGLAEAFGASFVQVRRALSRAEARQKEFDQERRRLGELALSSRFDRAVVVLGRPYNLHDPLLNLSLARHLDRAGLPAIPWDLLPLENVRIPARWRTLPWRYCRDQIRAVRWIRRDPRLFPIIVSSFGCGPDAFATKHLDALLRGRPHLLLEFDEHRGEAGLVTRIEAFADQIDAYCRTRKPACRAHTVTPGPRRLPAGRRFVLPPFSEHARVYAAVLRAAGYEATVLPPASDESLRLGERYSSGRECHPYVLLAGDFVRFLNTGPRSGDVFLVPNCEQPCLIRQYGDAMRMVKAAMGAGSPEIWEAAAADLVPLVGITGLARLYEGLLAVDVLLTLATRLRPYERHKGSLRDLLFEALSELELTLSSRGDVAAVVQRAAERMWTVPRLGNPGDLPVIGVTGDVYTRANEAGNHHLTERLETMGCEVWPSPSWAATSDVATVLDAQRAVGKARLKELALDGLALVVTERIRQRIREALPSGVAPLVMDPKPADLVRLARPYLGTASSNLLVVAVGKLVDFLRCGAAGAISAAGVNCAVGALAATAIPGIRAEFGYAPVISLTCGANLEPADRMRLETFVQQVKQRHRRRAA